MSSLEGGNVTSSSAYGEQRHALLDALARQLPERGLSCRIVGEGEPVLWVWHPETRKQTMVLASPAPDGWVYLWSPRGQESAGDPAHTADLLKELLAAPG